MYLDYIKQITDKKRICIFPMGIAGKSLLTKLRSVGIEVDCFCDNNSKLWGTEYSGKICISKDELLNNKENIIVIVESLHYKEIKKQLLDEGIQNIHRIFFEKIAAEKYVDLHKGTIQEKIQAVKEICSDEKSQMVFEHLTNSWFTENLVDDYFAKVYDKNQYFDKELICMGEEEVFVDLGAYIGDSADAFLENCDGKYEKMHLFELDPDIYKRLLQNASKLQEKGNGLVQIYPYGISSKNDEILFVGGDSNSSITLEGEQKGSIRRLDDILENEKVTFIKMDIEGSEMGALNGAANLIKKQRPTLAICIYHSPEDMLDIPLYIKSLVPEYKIYIRHYTDLMVETVCYAVVE